MAGRPNYTKIADFCSLLEELKQRTKHGIRDIHNSVTISHVCGDNVCATFNGVYYDSTDPDLQAVKFAKKNKDGSITFKRYYGNASKPVGNAGLDSYIQVTVRGQDKAPYVRVKVGGNGSLAVFIIKDGRCELGLDTV